MKKGQLTLAAFVILIAMFIFLVIVATKVIAPFISTTITNDPTDFSSFSVKYGAYLVSAVMVGAGIVMFFIPNTTVRGR